MAGRRAKRTSRRAAAKRKQLGDIKRLVDAILEKNDPVRVASKLLKCKSDATIAKIFALLIEYRFGKPVQQIEASGPAGEKIIYQFITTAPRPDYSHARDTEE